MNIIAEPVLSSYNRDELLVRCMGNEALADQLLKMFSDELLKELRSLRQRVADRDFPAVASQAHRLRGSSSSLSAKPLAESFGEIEKKVRNGDTSDLGSELSTLELEATCFLNAISKTNCP